MQGKDYRTQFQIGNNAFYGANYIQVMSISHFLLCSIMPLVQSTSFGVLGNFFWIYGKVIHKVFAT